MEAHGLKVVAWVCGVWRLVVCLWALFTHMAASASSGGSGGFRQRLQFSDPALNVLQLPASAAAAAAAAEGPPLPALVRRYAVHLISALLFATIAFLTGFAFQLPKCMRLAIFFQVILQATMSLGILGCHQPNPPLRHTLDVVIDSILILIMGSYCSEERWDSDSDTADYSISHDATDEAILPSTPPPIDFMENLLH